MSKFKEDIARYRSMGHTGKQFWLNQTIWALANYRFGHWLYVEGRPNPILGIPLRILFLFTNLFCETVMEMFIDPQARIGGGLYIGHIGGVHINPEAILGRNCNITHRVTIGASAMGRSGVPVLGDDVYVGTGATLVGKIKIGKGAKIAANTLVITNVPEGATVMGVPGRIIMRPPKAAAQPTASAVVTAEKSNA